MVWPWPSSLIQSESVWSAKMLNIDGSLCFGHPLCSPRLALWSTGLPSANKRVRSLAPHMPLQYVCVCVIYVHVHYTQSLIFGCSTFKWTMCKLKIISCKSAHKSVQGLNEQMAALINGFSTDTIHLMQSIFLNLLCVGWKHCTYDMLCKNNPSNILCTTLEHACIRYANDHLDPPTGRE